MQASISVYTSYCTCMLKHTTHAYIHTYKPTRYNACCTEWLHSFTVKTENYYIREVLNITIVTITA